ncbi:MAG: hypothetical protein QXL16_01160 [Candidatus Micrarchaeaceae archaeon]
MIYSIFGVAFAFILKLSLLAPPPSTPLQQSQAPSLCSTLFSNLHLPSSSFSNTFVFIALTIATVMILIGGLAYGIGYAFSYQKLKEFSKEEILEGILTFFIVIIIEYVVIKNISSLANFISGLISLSVSNGQSGPTLAPTSDLFQYSENAACSKIVAPALISLFNATILSSFLNTLGSIKLLLMPSQIGFGYAVVVVGYSFSPFWFANNLSQVVSLEGDVYASLAGLGAGLILMFFFIEGFMPILFLIGIALRAFPFSRAAGGAMISMFLSFYVIFPAIFYPFISNLEVSQYSSNPGSSAPVVSISSSKPPSSINPLQLFSFFSYMIYDFYSAIKSFIGIILGLVIAFLVSFDLLETFGDIFGSPSLSAQSHSFLSKII